MLTELFICDFIRATTIINRSTNWLTNTWIINPLSLSLRKYYLTTGSPTNLQTQSSGLDSTRETALSFLTRSEHVTRPRPCIICSISSFYDTFPFPVNFSCLAGWLFYRPCHWCEFELDSYFTLPVFICIAQLWGVKSKSNLCWMAWQ